MDDALLQTVWQQRRPGKRAAHVSQPIQMLMKYRLARRVRALSRMAEVWDEVVPADVRDHTALERLERGTLTVMVDSAAHRFRLQMLLNGGLLKEIRQRFSGALNKVRLVPGQFCAVDLAGESRYEF
jgi:predicted nucleic acid-binding Zn ribbon protein